MWNEEQIRLFNTFAPWFSAIGTIAAVITSLFLAKRQTKILLRVNAGYFISPHGIGKDGYDEFIVLSATNIGLRSASIAHFYYDLPFSKLTLLQLETNTQHSDVLPKMLKDGDEAKFIMTWDYFKNGIDRFFQHPVAKLFPRFYVKKIKICAVTTIGVRENGYISKSLADKLVDEYKAKSKKS